MTMNAVDNDSFSGYFGDSFEGIGLSFSSFEPIHQSNMFRVFKAERYGRRWVLKCLRDEYVDDETARQMLRKEFEIMNMVSGHPHVVSVVGLEEVPDLGSCIVMEYIDGSTLDVCRRCSMGKDVKRRLAEQMLKAVEYIHSKGVVHRDLKPSNIMVTNYGGVKLIDFGLADTYSHTVLRQAAGTPGYMSAEQFDVPVADVRNDIYSLGVVMREFGLTYKGVTKNCLKSIRRRYQSISELSQAIDRHRRMRRQAKRVGLSLVVLLAVTAAAYFLLHDRTASETGVTQPATVSGTISLSEPITITAAPPKTHESPPVAAPPKQTPLTDNSRQADTTIDLTRYGAAWYDGAARLGELYKSWPVKLHMDTLSDYRYYNNDYEKMSTDFEQFPARYVASQNDNLNSLEREKLLEQLVELQKSYKIIIPSKEILNKYRTNHQ